MSNKKRFPRAPRVLLTLTERRIADAVPRDSSHCMLAEAVKSAYPGAKYVAVDLQTIRFTDPEKGLRYTYLTPRLCQLALVNFDQGNLPEAFSVYLRNGQVTRAGRISRQLSEAEREQRKKSASKGGQATKKVALARAQLAKGEKDESVPDRIGGKTPPSTPFARRRAFGLRALVK